MQAGVDPLIILYVNRHLLAVQWFAIRRFVIFEVSPHHVVLLASRYSHSKLAEVVGIQLPAGLLFVLPPDIDLHPVERLVFWSPDRPKDQGVGLIVPILAGGRVTRSVDTPPETKD